MFNPLLATFNRRVLVDAALTSDVKLPSLERLFLLNINN